MKESITLFLLFIITAGLSAQDLEVPQEHRPLVMKHTATWCPPCGGDAWNTFEDLETEFAANAVFLQVHISQSSEFYSANAQDLLDNCNQSFFQPEFFYNTTRVGSGSGNTYSDMTGRIAEGIEEAPVAQSGVAFSYDEATGMIQVRTTTRFFSATSGDYYLSLFLAYKDVVGYQENRGAGQHHKHVLHSALTDNTFGERVLNGAIEAGTTQTRTISRQLPQGLSVDQVEVVAVLWNFVDGQYEFVNANLAQEQTQLTTAREHLAQLRAGFAIAPNLVGDHFSVRLELPASYPHLELTLFNLLGQPVYELHRGAFPQGLHQLDFYRPVQLDPGLYLLRLRAGKNIVTRRLVFQ